MKSRQLGFVLMALIAVGVAGLVFRIVSAGSDEIILEGLIQVSSQASDRVLVEGGGKRTELQRLGDAEQGAWYVDDQPVFAPQLQQFWQAVDDLYDAQLVSINPANHGRMGVVDGEATEISFFLGRRSLQEKFLVGTWKPDVRLCYVRRAGYDETYGVPCPNGNIFDPDPDRWKNPIAASIPPNEIQQIEFQYIDADTIESFAIRQDDEGEWQLYDAEGNASPTHPRALEAIFGTLQLVVASGFAEEEEGGQAQLRRARRHGARTDARGRLDAVHTSALPDTRRPEPVPAHPDDGYGLYHRQPGRGGPAAASGADSG